MAFLCLGKITLRGSPSLHMGPYSAHMKYGSSLDATVKTIDGDLPTVSLDIKPWVFAVGFGYKF